MTADKPGWRMSRSSWIFILVVVMALTGCRTNPVTGESQFLLLSSAEELQMGNRYHPNILFMSDGEYQDPELKQYLGTICKRLHACSHRTDMPVDFTVINTSMINAFAIPGHIYCTRGLLAEFENEAQFAAIMGHELGHVAAMHSARKMTTDVLINLGSAAAGAALADTENSEIYLTAGMFGFQMLNLSYSREQERQADRLGAYYMALAGWDPQQAIAAQRLIGGVGQKQPSFFAKYLSTHPPTEDRVGEIMSLLEEEKFIELGLLQGDGVYAKRWHRRLAELVADNQAFKAYDEGTQFLQDDNYQAAAAAAARAISAAPDQAPFFRLKGDALQGLKDFKQARLAYRQALQLDPRYVLANEGLATIALKKGQYPLAEDEFNKVVKGYPMGLNGIWGLSQALFLQERYKDAGTQLEKVVQVTGGQMPESCFLLAICYEKQEMLRPALQQYQQSIASGLVGKALTTAQSRADALSTQFAQAEAAAANTKKNNPESGNPEPDK